MQQREGSTRMRGLSPTLAMFAAVIATIGSDSCLPATETVLCGTNLRCPLGYFCSTDQTTCVQAICGDGQIGPDEECDDGNIIDGDGCDSNCTITRCGNNVVTQGEECDDGNLNDGNLKDDNCDHDCTKTRCGNGIVTLGEQCDLGMMNSNNGECLLNCQLARCGDGQPQGGVEACDYGMMNSNDGACLTNCQTARCGDGYVRQGVETCDDGNMDECGTCKAGCNEITKHAMGVIVAIPAAAIHSGETFSFESSSGVAIRTFQFYYASETPPSVPPDITLIRVVASGGNPDTALDVAQKIVKKINEDRAELHITASVLNGAIVSLAADYPGEDRNYKIGNTVRDVDFRVAGMLGGTGSGLCPKSVGCKSNGDCESQVCLAGICQ